MFKKIYVKKIYDCMKLMDFDLCTRTLGGPTATLFLFMHCFYSCIVLSCGGLGGPSGPYKMGVIYYYFWGYCSNF